MAHEKNHDYHIYILPYHKNKQDKHQDPHYQ